MHRRTARRPVGRHVAAHFGKGFLQPRQLFQQAVHAAAGRAGQPEQPQHRLRPQPVRLHRPEMQPRQPAADGLHGRNVRRTGPRLQLRPQPRQRSVGVRQQMAAAELALVQQLDAVLGLHLRVSRAVPAQNLNRVVHGSASDRVCP